MPAYAVAMQRYAVQPPPRSRPAFYLGAASAFWMTWQIAPLAGALGNGVPGQIPWGSRCRCPSLLCWCADARRPAQRGGRGRSRSSRYPGPSGAGEPRDVAGSRGGRFRRHLRQSPGHPGWPGIPASTMWIVIVSVSLCTMAIRGLFLVRRRLTVPGPGAMTALRMIPPAAFAALVVPALLRPNGPVELLSPGLLAEGWPPSSPGERAASPRRPPWGSSRWGSCSRRGRGDPARRRAHWGLLVRRSCARRSRGCGHP